MRVCDGAAFFCCTLKPFAYQNRSAGARALMSSGVPYCCCISLDRSTMSLTVISKCFSMHSTARPMAGENRRKPRQFVLLANNYITTFRNVRGNGRPMIDDKKKISSLVPMQITPLLFHLRRVSFDNKQSTNHSKLTMYFKPDAFLFGWGSVDDTISRSNTGRGVLSPKQCQCCLAWQSCAKGGIC